MIVYPFVRHKKLIGHFLVSHKFSLHFTTLECEKDWRDNFNADVAYKVCYICRRQFLGLHQLTKHLRSHMEQDGPFGCLKCSKKLTSGPLLHEHMRFHYNAKDASEIESSKTNTNYSCQFCSQAQFSTAKSFCEHMVQLHNQKPFQCSNCGLGYMHKSNLEDHIKAKHGGDQPDIPCDKCGKLFRTKTSLFVHRREQVSLKNDTVVLRTKETCAV